METLYFLIPLAILLLGIAAAGFLWAIRSGQFDDLEGPAYRILMDDDDPKIPVRQPPPEDKPEDRSRARDPASGTDTEGEDPDGGGPR
ncbi:cytochrome oxidase maturation protein, cbb3-type [Thiohalospira halophila DSM 15071]|uniref:Cytochrome oxidase maturation protein, cbb3-type n=1 Tax=Thiohalospira halophila DSM 15071 TaxID=1123397 RepID=A0A1I1TBQ8_9GAMM|nr:cbb3-type cytochrome oxidase assembly protein CcoS [Thiohalospira halophila]SFD53743.1 cytochrome oxidase maturation protein, cbb3-type [Thiohalospira halophila DSM 15071]